MTWVDIERIINKPYVGIEDTMILAQVGYNQARGLINEIKEEMMAEHVPFFHTRKALVPTQRMVEKLGISTEYVRAQANQMRGGTR